MPNSSTHLAAGAATGFLISMLPTESNEVTLNPLVGIGVGTLAGKLPDILEPALNPHHRQFFHSLVFAGTVAYGMKKAYDWQTGNGNQKFLRGLALVAGGAYLSHLIFDASTPMSLPVLGKI